jgi:hypothetical protein
VAEVVKRSPDTHRPSPPSPKEVMPHAAPHPRLSGHDKAVPQSSVAGGDFDRAAYQRAYMRDYMRRRRAKR